jgi:N-acetylneuraminic acid mutarotase
MAVLDLQATPLAWKSVPQPFRRRALMAAAYAGKLYVIGGFNDKGQIVREMSIYDPATGNWSGGPKLPAGPGLSFAPAAGEHAGALYVSVSDGTLLRLKQSGLEWERVGKSTARLAHRIASNGTTVLVIGGAEKGKNSDLVEAVTVESGK